MFNGHSVAEEERQERIRQQLVRTLSVFRFAWPFSIPTSFLSSVEKQLVFTESQIEHNESIFKYSIK